LGERPFAEIMRLVDDIVTVREESIVQAMRQIWEVMKLIVEPSGAVSYAAVIEGRVAASGANIAIILSGGNLDLNRLPWQ
jgi:threonine dehydratase